MTTLASEVTSPEALKGTYAIDPTHSSIGFVARHAMITKVRGAFNKYEAKGTFDDAGISISVDIDASSVDTRNEDRDNHLRSADFFDVEKYPTWTFRSTDVKIVGDELSVTGDLTIRDTTKPVSFNLEYTGAATDPFGNHRVGLEGSVVVNRKDWGLTWNAALEAGGVLVSEKITLAFELSAVRTQD